MKQWLFVIRPSREAMISEGPTEQEMQLVGQHFAYWQDLTTRGVAFVVGRQQQSDPIPEGYAIYQAETEEEAKAIANNDPAVAHGVFKHQVFPYFVALLGDPEPFRPKD